MLFLYTKELVSLIKEMQMGFCHCRQVLHIDMTIYAHLLTYFALLI